MSQGNRGVSRVLVKLKASIEEGKYYEAHQMYRTLNFRYCGQGKFKEVIELLYEGASLLLSHNQQSSGADLCLLMLDALEKSKATPNEENMTKIAKLYQLLSSGIHERHQYLVRAVKWSSSGQYTQGHPRLHQLLAQILWREENYTCAKYHFLRSADGSSCGIMLVELHRLRGYPSEVDLFVTQAVLQYLCLQKKVEASDVFKSYTKEHPVLKRQPGPPFLLPLLNFLWLLLIAVDSGRVAHFTVLVEYYKPSLKRDRHYAAYLDRIGQLFFGITPVRERPTPGGFIGNIIQGLLRGLDSDDENDMSDTPVSVRTMGRPDDLD